ncbi:hypothetical protein ACTWWB_002619 [Vibrio fluvialis]|uniref:hypothetical protein n=1 Tax=Vibrio fluvialis TaxID=676 RepID=UPI001BAF206B|nr:hypothetical protein [Vibrio fluvialis]EKO3971165.1 hypothetical protein [Vibrio fluvialis]EKZ9000825.1 hypothetical protein [Vibrio fluvialis]ELI1829604.1 hypothetical protein [Vibrio fluvialis]QUF67979.1 hypothetical protein KC397_10285 [Vibrio fluvialis]
MPFPNISDAKFISLAHFSSQQKALTAQLRVDVTILLVSLSVIGLHDLGLFIFVELTLNLIDTFKRSSDSYQVKYNKEKILCSTTLLPTPETLSSR